jgi:hypothetical protein
MNLFPASCCSVMLYPNQCLWQLVSEFASLLTKKGIRLPQVSPRRVKFVQTRSFSLEDSLKLKKPISILWWRQLNKVEKSANWTSSKKECQWKVRSGELITYWVPDATAHGDSHSRVWRKFRWNKLQIECQSQLICTEFLILCNKLAYWMYWVSE